MIASYQLEAIPSAARMQRKLRPCALLYLASADRRSEDVRVLPIVVSELKFRNVERHVFGADLTEASDDPALEDAPETFKGGRLRGPRRGQPRQVQGSRGLAARCNARACAFKA
jgi:hypothetical protein